MDNEREAKLESLGEHFRELFGVEAVPELFTGLLASLDEKTKSVGAPNGTDRNDNA